jgi:hypothetical protein
MTNKSALELFRDDGLDYIQISEILKIPVPHVERQIHALRSAEKGDTSQQEYRDTKRLREEKRAEVKRWHVAKANAISLEPRPRKFAGYDHREKAWGE